MKVMIIQNEDDAPPGHLERVCLNLGHEVEVVHPGRGDQLPTLDGVDAVVALGGAMGAYDTDAYPFLIEEKAVLKRAVESGLAVLGLCLGCQLLADALGGRAYRADAPEAGFMMLRMHPDSRDPVVGILASRRSLVVHQDTWMLPPDAELIASTPGYNQIFRYGTALGIQSHPEITGKIVSSWFADSDFVQMVRDASADPESLLEAIMSADDEISDTAEELFGAWLAEAEAHGSDAGSAGIS